MFSILHEISKLPGSTAGHFHIAMEEGVASLVDLRLAILAAGKGEEIGENLSFISHQMMVAQVALVEAHLVDTDKKPENYVVVFDGTRSPSNSVPLALCFVSFSFAFRLILCLYLLSFS